MRILYHHRTQAEDAQGVHIAEMIKAFRDLGHEVEVVALVKKDASNLGNDHGTTWGWLRNFAPNWFYELMSLGYNLYGYRKLCETVKSKRPDFIYERYSLNTFCGIWASRRFEIPLILEVNSPLCYEQNSLGQLTFKRLSRFSERWICSNSKKTIVVSKVMRDILKREGIPDEKIIVIPNGIDPEKFHPNISGDPIRQRYGLNGKIIIGFVGWFRKWHGLKMLLEIFHEADLAEKGIGVLLVGDGPAYPDLSRYVKRHNLEPSVIFTGPVKGEDIPAHIAAMDIAVQPSVTAYACPIKLIEYMAMGKCIVAPDQPNIREILEDAVNAYLFKPGDQDDFYKVLLNTIKNSAGREFVGRNAWETIHGRKYFWSTNVERTLDLFFGHKL
jgi:glycosyltransferase involved in cell wall biosynthesis